MQTASPPASDSEQDSHTTLLLKTRKDEQNEHYLQTSRRLSDTQSQTPTRRNIYPPRQMGHDV